MSNEKIKLKILGITFSQVQAGAYALILAEEKGIRRVPIIIGTPEAQSIAIYLEGLTPPRPLTHDLFITFINALHITLKEVFIYKYEDGVFFSELLFNDNGEELRIDSRTSDAIALAIRTQSAIYITEEIMIEVAVFMEEDELLEELDQEINGTPSVDAMNSEELQNALDEAIAKEDYEKASFLRDLINKRSK